MKNNELNPDLAEVLAQVRPSLAEKIRNSIHLLQRGEKLARLYDHDDGYYLAFSGGKDSQALYHVARLAGVPFRAHMSLTSVDPPEVIRFVKTQYPDVEIKKPPMAMWRMAIKKKILPTMRMRWCCAEYKETGGAGKVTLIGIRAAESVRRSKRHEVEIKSRKYSGDFDGFEKWQQGQKMKTRSGQRVNEDEFSVKTDNEVRCISGKDSILISPIFTWTERDVWDFIAAVGASHCTLYDEGNTRIGCILCPMSGAKQKRREIQRWPQMKENWIKAIIAIINQPMKHKGRTAYGEDIAGTDRERAEKIFDWWTSGLPFQRWRAKNILQQKLNFDKK